MATYLNGSDLMLIGESLSSLKCCPPKALHHSVSKLNKHQGRVLKSKNFTYVSRSFY